MVRRGRNQAVGGRTGGNVRSALISKPDYTWLTCHGMGCGLCGRVHEGVGRCGGATGQNGVLEWAIIEWRDLPDTALNQNEGVIVSNAEDEYHKAYLDTERCSYGKARLEGAGRWGTA